jgi:hypothetical protein
LSNPAPLKNLNQSNGIIHAFYQPTINGCLDVVLVVTYAFHGKFPLRLATALSLFAPFFFTLVCMGPCTIKEKECKVGFFVFFHK